MKKKYLVALIALIAIAVLTLSACSHTFTCGMCGKEKTESGHKMEVMGRELEICDSCYNSYKSLLG